MTTDARHLATDPCRRTPDHVLDLVRQLLGVIDFDPASDLTAAARVGARYWLGPESPWGTDGLSRYWYGKVWLNPPGGIMPDRTSSAATWWRKLVTEHQSDRVTEALYLAFTLEALRTTQGLDVPSLLAYPICVPRARLRFPASGAGSTTVNSPAAASAIVYLGPRVDRFREIFADLGEVRL